MSKNKIRDFADKILDSIQRKHEKALSESRKEFKYDKWVLDNLDLAYDYVFRSLEDQELSESYVVKASVLFPTLHFENLRNNQEQETNFNDKIRSRIRATIQQKLNEKSLVPRKDKSIQKFYPTKEAAFQYLVKQIVSAAEKEQETAGQPISADAALFRFYGKLNDNNISVQPTSKSLSGLFGILYDMPSNLLVSMNSLLRNIDINLDTDNPYYHDKKYFDTTGLESALNLYERFQKTNLFETLPINAQEYHKDIKKALAKHIDTWFRFRPANEEEVEYIDNILERHITWGVTPLAAERLPKYDFRYTPIEHFILNDEHLGNINAIRDNEQKLRASLLSRDFRKGFLSNKSMELKNMKANMLMPVVKGDNPEGRMTWKEVKPLDPKVKYEIASKALSRPMTFQQLQEFYLSVEVDGVEIATADSDSGKLENIIIPPDGKILSVWAKTKNALFSENSLPLASLFLDFTSVMEGMKWSSESVLENGKHIGLHLIPVTDSENQIMSMSLTVTYHRPEECPVSFRKISLASRFRGWVRDNFTEIVPARVESFLGDIQPLGLYSERQTNQKIFRYSLGFMISMILLVLGINLLLVFYRLDFIAASTITAIELILIVFSNMILQKLARKKGINYSFRLSHQYGFLAGMVTLLSLTMIFNPIRQNISLNKHDSNVDIPNVDIKSDVPTYEKNEVSLGYEQVVVLTDLSQSKAGASEEQIPPLSIRTYKVIVSTGRGKNVYQTKVNRIPAVASGTKVNAFLIREHRRDNTTIAAGDPSPQEITTMIATVSSKLNELEINFKQSNIQFNRNDVMLIYFEKLEETQPEENNTLTAENKPVNQDSINELLTHNLILANTNKAPSKVDEAFADNSLPKQAIATR